MGRSATSSPRGRVRSARLETRLTLDQKDLIERAAALQSRTVTDFVLFSVQEAVPAHDGYWATLPVRP